MKGDNSAGYFQDFEFQLPAIFYFFLEISDVQWLFPPLHSLYPLTERLSKHISTIFWKGRWRFEDFFWRGGLMGKGSSIFGGRFQGF